MEYNATRTVAEANEWLERVGANHYEFVQTVQGNYVMIDKASNRALINNKDNLPALCLAITESGKCKERFGNIKRDWEIPEKLSYNGVLMKEDMYFSKRFNICVRNGLNGKLEHYGTDCVTTKLDKENNWLGIESTYENEAKDIYTISGTSVVVCDSKGNPKQPVAHCIGPEGEWGFIALDIGDCIAEVNCNFKEISLTISKVKEINKKTGKATMIKNYYVGSTIILDEEYLIHEFTTVYKAVLNAYHKALDFEWNRKMYFKAWGSGEVSEIEADNSIDFDLRDKIDLYDFFAETTEEELKEILEIVG